MRWKNIRLGFKLTFGFGIVLSLLAVVAVNALWGFGEIVTSDEKLTGYNLLQREFLQREIDHLDWVKSISNTLIKGEERKLNIQTDYHKCAFGQWYYGEKRKELEQIIPSTVELLVEIETPHIHIHETAIEINGLLAEDISSQSLDVFVGKTLPRLQEFRELILRIRKQVEHETDLTAQQMLDVIDDSKTIVAASTLLAVFAGISMAGLITMSITRPLRKVVNVAEQIAKGDLTRNTLMEDRLDEVGLLAQGMNTMKDRLAEVLAEINRLIGELQAGRLTTRGKAHTFGGDWGEVITGMNHLIEAFMTPIMLTSVSLDHISHGDIPQTIQGDYPGDFSLMRDNLTRLAETLRRIIGEIRSGVAVLLDSLHDLTASSHEISSTANQQAAAAKEIVSTMEDSDQLARSIAAKTQDVTSMTAASQHTVNEGVSMLQMSLAKMDEIKQANACTIAEIKSLTEQIGSIWDIVTMIDNIADQTKIIAFNAELEASSARDAGKNFRIVASEIRRLADNTVSSTSEIRTKITEIQHTSDQLIMTSEQDTLKIREGCELSQQLQQIFGHISESSETSTRAVEQISFSIQQQVSAFEQILQTLKQISEGVDSFVISTTVTTSTAETLRELANKLRTVIEEYAGTHKQGFEQ